MSISGWFIFCHIHTVGMMKFFKILKKVMNNMKSEKNRERYMKEKILLITGGVFAIPFLSICGLTFMIIGILFPVWVVIEVLTGSISRNFQILISDSIEYNFNILWWSVPNYLQMPIAIIFGMLLFLSGRWLWKLFKKYLNLLKASCIVP